ncbi:hypothetical protein P692DRAFT_20870418 [Suillus brevipes Sb2]|nr:hypothetical protein P692DRAFT_20870418 [Suillus brevipes Sb2]
MVGVQVDKKDIVRVDKSSALSRLTESLLVQFQKALWASDGGDLNEDSTDVTRRAWKLLKVICPMLERAQYCRTPSFDIMRNLDVCRKIYSRVRSSQPDDPSNLLHTLQNALHFIFTAASISRDHAEVWYGRCDGDAHSPEDFDWLVDYLDYTHSRYLDNHSDYHDNINSNDHDSIHPDDHEAAYEILLLLGSMGVSCSPVKQNLLVKELIAYMDSTIPDHVRHAAHSAREKLASIDTIDDALRDMILTKLSPAILSVLCLQPSTTPADDDSVYSPNHFRDLVYLELVYALARNSDWHRYFDSHIDQCIRMIPEYCLPESPM